MGSDSASKILGKLMYAYHGGDLDGARRWGRKAMETGSAAAHYYFGLVEYVDGNLESALDLLRTAARQGFEEAPQAMSKVEAKLAAGKAPEQIIHGWELELTEAVTTEFAQLLMLGKRKMWSDFAAQFERTRTVAANGDYEGLRALAQLTLEMDTLLGDTDPALFDILAQNMEALGDNFGTLTLRRHAAGQGSVSAMVSLVVMGQPLLAEWRPQIEAGGDGRDLWRLACFYRLRDDPTEYEHWKDAAVSAGWPGAVNTIANQVARAGDVQAALDLLRGPARAGDPTTLGSYTWWLLTQNRFRECRAFAATALPRAVQQVEALDGSDFSQQLELLNVRSNVALAAHAMGDDVGDVWDEGARVGLSESVFFPLLIEWRRDPQRAMESASQLSRRLVSSVAQDFNVYTADEGWFGDWCRDGFQFASQLLEVLGDDEDEEDDDYDWDE